MTFQFECGRFYLFTFLPFSFTPLFPKRRQTAMQKAVHPQFRCMEYKANKHIHPIVIQAEDNMFRRICNPPKFTIRICNPLKPHIYIMMYVGERIANPHLETAGLQIRWNKYAYT